MFTIAKRNNDKVSFLYKDHTGRYLFSGYSNMTFNTEEEALQFIYYNSDCVKHLMKKDETLYVLPVGKKKEDIKVVLQE